MKVLGMQAELEGRVDLMAAELLQSWRSAPAISSLSGSETWLTEPLTAGHHDYGIVAADGTQCGRVILTPVSFDSGGPHGTCAIGLEAYPGSALTPNKIPALLGVSVRPQSMGFGFDVDVSDFSEALRGPWTVAPPFLDRDGNGTTLGQPERGELSTRMDVECRHPYSRSVGFVVVGPTGMHVEVTEARWVIAPKAIERILQPIVGPLEAAAAAKPARLSLL